MKLNDFQKKLPKGVVDTAKEYGLALPEDAYDNEHDFWNCHGKWIIKHDACEIIADKERIVFKPPVQNMDISPNVALLIEGVMLDEEKKPIKNEWSFGEACARNTKMGYWWAMAEKRGKDRVILKLINAYEKGIYSETEADDWNQMAQKKKSGAKQPAAKKKEVSTDEKKEVSTDEKNTSTTTSVPQFADEDIPF